MDFGRALNVLRRNHRKCTEYYDTGQSQRKDPRQGKWELDILKIKEKLDESFGSNLAAIRRATTYSKLAECEVVKSNIGWMKMIDYIPQLREYVDNALATGELYEFGEDDAEPAPTEPEAHTQRQDLDADSDDGDDGDGDGGDDSGGDSDHDQDETLAARAHTLSTKNKKDKEGARNTEGLTLTASSHMSCRVLRLHNAIQVIQTLRTTSP